MAYVPGVTPGKWIGRWNERQDRELQAYQCPENSVVDELRAGRADVVFIRIPAEGFARPDGVNVIPLYEEQPVAAASKEHPLAAFDAVDLADLDGETILDIGEMGGAAVALEVAAAGSGVVILPMSVARLHSRKDVAARPVNGVPATRIAIAWLQDRDEADIEEFIGVVRGRTANSSRQPSIQAEQKSSAKKRTKERQTRSAAKPAAKSGGRPAGKGKGAGKNGKPRRSR